MPFKTFLAYCGAVLALSACGAVPQSTGTVGQGAGFAVVADERHAVAVAQEILAAEGSAADAAVALAFALSVTHPSSAGIGGGGVCLVHDRKSKTTETLEFFSPAGTASPETARPSAVPSMVRGMAALHAKYGHLRWEELLAPAEALARSGSTVSRFLADDFATMGDSLFVDSEAYRIFGRPQSGNVGRGDRIVQADLANLLGKIRQHGPDEFYLGPSARTVVDAVKMAGGSLTPEDLRAVAPRWGLTLRVRFGDSVAHFPPPPSAGGVAAQMWAMLSGDGGYQKAPVESRGHLIAETELRALFDRTRWMLPGGESRVAPAELVNAKRIAALTASLNNQRHIAVKESGKESGKETTPALIENPSATGFIVADREESVVACTLTMNNLFGVGRIAPGTGMFLAAAPHRAGRGPYALASMIVHKRETHRAAFAATGGGGAPAAAAMIHVAAQTLLGGTPLVDALAAPRLHSSPAADVTLVEKSDHPVLEDALRQRGHLVTLVNVLGQVNAMSCPDGFRFAQSCFAGSDPRVGDPVEVEAPVVLDNKD